MFLLPYEPYEMMHVIRDYESFAHLDKLINVTRQCCIINS